MPNLQKSKYPPLNLDMIETCPLKAILQYSERDITKTKSALAPKAISKALFILILKVGGTQAHPAIWQLHHYCKYLQCIICLAVANGNAVSVP